MQAHAPGSRTPTGMQQLEDDDILMQIHTEAVVMTHALQALVERLHASRPPVPEDKALVPNVSYRLTASALLETHATILRHDALQAIPCYSPILRLCSAQDATPSMLRRSWSLATLSPLLLLQVSPAGRILAHHPHTPPEHIPRMSPIMYAMQHGMQSTKVAVPVHPPMAWLPPPTSLSFPKGPHTSLIPPPPTMSLSLIPSSVLTPSGLRLVTPLGANPLLSLAPLTQGLSMALVPTGLRQRLVTSVSAHPRTLASKIIIIQSALPPLLPPPSMSGHGRSVHPLALSVRCALPTDAYNYACCCLLDYANIHTHLHGHVYIHTYPYTYIYICI